jgi:putative MFS transporter
MRDPGDGPQEALRLMIVTPDHRIRTMTVAERMDRLPVSEMHLAILALCTLGLFVDIAEVAISNALGAVFRTPPYTVAPGELSLLLASVFAGGAIGAPVFGWFGDRYGRRRALQLSLAIISVSSLAAAASPDVWWMTVCRFVSGFAIGGYPPLTAAYLSDLLPPARRGALMMLCAALGFLGAPAIIFLIRELEPLLPLGLEAWRWSLVVGGVVGAVSALLFMLIPESPRWLASVGRYREAEHACLRFEQSAGMAPRELPDAALPDDVPAESGFSALVSSSFRPRAVLLAALYVLGPWATIGFPLLSAAVLVEKGYSVRDSLLFAAVSMFGPTIGNVIAAAVIDRIERRIMIIGCAVAMIATGLVFAASEAFSPLMVAGIAFNLMSAVYSAALAVYATELFPTHLRASATAGAWGFGRAASALVPVALLPLLTGHGVLAMFAVISAALLASLALIAIAGPPGLTRKPLA